MTRLGNHTDLCDKLGIRDKQLADTVIHSPKLGIENVNLGPVAEDVIRRFKEDPLLLERDIAQLRSGRRL